tara:strand:- start:65 stop:823 length:759 start_codon:yes stop_codon:yes gene_type:complete
MAKIEISYVQYLVECVQRDIFPPPMDELIGAIENKELWRAIDENSGTTLIAFLGEEGDRRGIDPLIKVLEGHNYGNGMEDQVRLEAFSSLRMLRDKFGGKRATEALTKALNDDDSEVRDQATDYFEGMTLPNLKSILKELGLSVSGKKEELVDRLKESAKESDMNSEKGSVDPFNRIPLTPFTDKKVIELEIEIDESEEETCVRCKETRTPKDMSNQEWYNFCFRHGVCGDCVDGLTYKFGSDWNDWPVDLY